MCSPVVDFWLLKLDIEVMAPEDRRKKRRKVDSSAAKGSSSSDEGEGSGASDEDDDSDGGYRGPLGRSGTASRPKSQRSANNRNNRNSSSASALNGNANGNANGDVEDYESDDLYESSPNRQQARRDHTTQTTSQLSRMSIASSLPASQLPSTQTDSQGRDSQNQSALTAAEEDYEEEDEVQQSPISPSRLAAFRSTLGRLMNTRLFANDSANVDPLIEAVNDSRTGSSQEVFGREEAIKALRVMNEENQIM